MVRKCKPARFAFSMFLSAALAVTMMPAMFAGSQPAFAGENQAKAGQAAVEELAANMVSGDEAFRFSSEEGMKAQEAQVYPAKFDLRAADLGNGVKNYVTPVKFQNPFGTCWGFSAIASAETSLLSSGLVAPENLDEAGNLNLSEKHLVYFITQPIDDPDNSQYGEGNVYREGLTTQDKFNGGGIFFYATSLFSSGIGPNLENRMYPDSTDPSLTMEDILGYHGKNKKIEKRKIAVKENGTTVNKWVNFNYEGNDDWDIDHEYRFLQSYILKESNCLPSPASFTKGADGKQIYHYNEAATDVFKKELTSGRAISIAFLADTSQPNQEGDAKYMSKDWAHYTYENPGINHGVTIVGWDDNYPKENFVPGHQPPENGAWLVKNSWGSGEESFPNRGGGNWGMEKTDADGNPVLDENGDPIHTGYFWLSYYDQTISTAETFEFDRSNVNQVYELHQYDLMPVSDVYGSRADTPIKMANVFQAEDAVDLEQVSCQTTYTDTKVTYNIYLLPKNYKKPDDGYLAATIGPVSYEYGGYHKESLETPIRIQPGQNFAIEVEEQTGDQYAFNTQTGVNEAYAREKGYSNWTKAVINEGESFLFSGGQYVDYSEKKLQKKLMGDDAPYLSLDNFPIKAFCKPSDDDTGMNLYLGNAIDLANDVTQTSLAVRLTGATEPSGDSAIKYTSVTPDIVEVEADPDNDSFAVVTAKQCGVGYISVSLDGVGTAIAKIAVNPPQPEIIKIKAGKKKSKKLTVKFGIIEGYDFDGYEISYRVKGTEKWKTKNILASKTSVTLKKLKKGKKYEVKVRSVKNTWGEGLMSKWSSAVSPKVK